MFIKLTEHDPFTMWRDNDTVPYHAKSHASFNQEEFDRQIRLRNKLAELVKNAEDTRKKGTLKSWHTPDEEQKK